MNKLKKIIISHIVSYNEALIPYEDIYENLELTFNKKAVLNPHYDLGDETALYNRKVIYSKLCKMKQPMIDLESIVIEYVNNYGKQIDSLNNRHLDTSESTYYANRDYFMNFDNPLLKDKTEFVYMYYYYNAIIKHIINHGIMFAKIRAGIFINNYKYKYYDLLNETDKCIKELEDVIDVLTSCKGPNEKFENILLKEIKKKFKKTKPVKTIPANETKKQNHSLFDIASGVLGALNAFNDFFDVEKEDKERRNKELEDEMDLYDLDEEEKELVRSGEWEPWQFDTDPDELDEESYYYEDDLR